MMGCAVGCRSPRFVKRYADLRSVMTDAPAPTPTRSAPVSSRPARHSSRTIEVRTRPAPGRPTDQEARGPVPTIPFSSCSVEVTPRPDPLVPCPGVQVHPPPSILGERWTVRSTSTKDPAVPVVGGRDAVGRASDEDGALEARRLLAGSSGYVAGPRRRRLRTARLAGHPPPIIAGATGTPSRSWPGTGPGHGRGVRGEARWDRRRPRRRPGRSRGCLDRRPQHRGARQQTHCGAHADPASARVLRCPVCTTLDRMSSLPVRGSGNRCSRAGPPRRAGWRRPRPPGRPVHSVDAERREWNRRGACPPTTDLLPVPPRRNGDDPRMPRHVKKVSDSQ